MNPYFDMNPPLCSQSLEACEVKLPALVHLSETGKPETSSGFLQLESELLSGHGGYKPYNLGAVDGHVSCPLLKNGLW